MMIHHPARPSNLTLLALHFSNDDLTSVNLNWPYFSLRFDLIWFFFCESYASYFLYTFRGTIWPQLTRVNLNELNFSLRFDLIWFFFCESYASYFLHTFRGTIWPQLTRVNLNEIDFFLLIWFDFGGVNNIGNNCRKLCELLSSLLFQLN